MFKLVKFAIGLVLVAVFVWFGATVPLGKHTLFGHVSRIWNSDETQDLVEGTKESAGPAVDKVKRGVKAGMEEASKKEK
jgi:hypothetical protein